MTSGTRTRQGLALCAVFVLATAVRLLLDLGRGYEGDIAIYLGLTWKIVHFGIPSAYLNLHGVPPSDNPPGLLYPFWLVGQLYRLFHWSSFPSPALVDPPLLRFMLRLPSLVADLVVGWTIYRVLRGQALSVRLSLLSAGAYLFNPAVIFDSAYWGQTAAVHGGLMLLAIVATSRRAYAWAGGLLAAAVLTKPQALAIVPVVLMLAAREGRGFRLALTGMITALVIVAPFAAAGQLSGVVTQYWNSGQYHPVLSANAHNMWWLATAGHGWTSDAVSVTVLSARAMGIVLFAGATWLSMRVVARDRRDIFLAAAYQSLAFFMLNTEIHENHLLPMFAPLAIAAASTRGARWLYGAFAVAALANMALHDPNLITWPGVWTGSIYGDPRLAAPRLLNAGLQCALFLMFTWRLIVTLLPGGRVGAPRMARTDVGAGEPAAVRATAHSREWTPASPGRGVASAP